MAEIKKENYHEAAARYCQTAGYAKGAVPVISVKETPVEFVAWMAYFDSLGMGWSLKEMRRMWNAGEGTWTVPARHPADFDMAFLLTEADCLPWAGKEPVGPELTIEQRKKFSEGALKGFWAGRKPSSGQEAAE